MTATLRVGDVDVFVEGQGSDTVVMVHGWPDTWRLWDGTVAALRGEFRCVRFTWPGFDIDRPRRARSLDDLVETLQAVVDAVSPDRPVVLVAHDWGCLFGYEWAMRHPQRVQRIVGIDIGDAGSRAHAKALTAKAKAMIFAYQAWLALAWGVGGVAAGVGDRMTRWMARQLRCPADARFIGAHMNFPYFIQWTGRHGGYRHKRPFDPAVPMLFIFGTRKPFMFHSTAWADALAARAGCAVLPMKTGHWVMNNDAPGFERAVHAWLRGPTPS
jgi:pimeloyl-ACP methyl ester carboxylesterase